MTLSGYLDKDLGLLPRMNKWHIDWKAFVASLISGFITHVYCMVNLVENEDTITTYTPESADILSTFRGAGTGRWLAGAVNWMQGWYRTPVVSGILVILTIAFLAQIFIHLFQIRTAAGAFLIAVFLEVSSPVQAYINLHEIGYPISALLAVLGVHFMRRSHVLSGNKKAGGVKNWIFSFLCESVALVILPVNISCSAIILLMLLILDTVPDGSRNKFSSRHHWIWTLQCLLVLLCSGMFLFLSSRVIIKVYGVDPTGYQGASQAISGGFLPSLFPNYLHSFVKLFIIGVWKIQTMPVLRFGYYICYVLDVICVIFLLKESGGRDKIIRILHLILYLFLLPAAICTISLVSYGFMYRGQHRMALILFVCGTIPLVELVLKEAASSHTTGSSQHSPLTCKALYFTMLGAFVIMIYAGFLFDNIGYVNQHHVMQQDEALCTRILTKLDSEEDFSYDQPVYFLNILSEDGNEAVTPLKYDPELYSVIWPVATTNLYAYGDSSLRFHMESYEGVAFEKPSDEVIRQIENSGLTEIYGELKPWDFRIIRQYDTWIIVVKTVMPPNVKYG